MILVANGCSHTAGAEMEYPSQRRCYNKAWPKHLADFLKCDHVNLSDSGASGHRVVRTTMRYVLDQFSKKNNLSDHLFIINWPGAYRTELRRLPDGTEEENLLFYDNHWLPLIVGNDESYKNTFTKRLYTFYKSWVLTSEHIKPRMDYLHDILLLQNFFILYKIKFLFWSASYVNITQADKELEGYKSLVHKKTFPYLSNIEYSYNVLLKNNNQKISEHSVLSGFGSHYDEDAQRWFASYLHSYLANSSII